MDPAYDYLTPEERREARVQYLISQAATHGVRMTSADYEHEDVDELVDTDYMTQQQIAKLEEYEKKIKARAEATRPPPLQGTSNAPVLTEDPNPTPNIVRYDNIIAGGISDDLKTQLVGYAPVERLISLVSSWRIQQRGFRSHEAFTGQLARFGCTCIMRPTGTDGGMCEYTLDAYYEQKKKDAEKKRRAQKEVRTATSVARMAARMAGIARSANTRVPMSIASEEQDDDEDARQRALRAAQGGGDGPLFTPSSIEFVELDEIPAFADDHVQMRVKLRKVPGESVLVVETVEFVVREVEY